MAIKKKKAKKAAIEMTLWDVILSYPDLHEPKPFKGKVYYRSDCLMDEDHPQLGQLRKNIKRVKVMAFGDDSSEWPDGAKKKFVQDGNEREDQKGYKDRFYITASTQTPVPVVNTKGKEFNAQMVKGGMFANVAIRISAWEFDGDEGISIYLQGVQVDTTKKSLNFGGGKSVDQMFKRDGDDEDESEDSDESDEDIENQDEADEDDEDDQPRNKKKAKKSRDDEEDEDSDEPNEDDEDSDDDEEDEKPRGKKKPAKKAKKSRHDDDDDDSEE